MDQTTIRINKTTKKQLDKQGKKGQSYQTIITNILQTKKGEQNMKEYKDLNEQNKILFKKLERIYINHQTIRRTSFVEVLGVLINKHKQ